VFESVRTGASQYKLILNLIQTLRRTAIPVGKPQKMFWINSLSILGNVCGAVFASMFAHLMRCSGQTHQCQQGKAEAN
jgi:formate/nitrite transporter FocA (FNT family)